jgi:hypothetical protein
MEKNPVSRKLQQRDASLERDGEIPAKNKYATPHLVEYGTIAKLTRSGSPGALEAGMGSMCL